MRGQGDRNAQLHHIWQPWLLALMLFVVCVHTHTHTHTHRGEEFYHV